MQREIPFIIKGKDNLLDALKPYPILASYYSKPAIWTIMHGSRPKLTLNDWPIAIKLLFMADFRSKAIETKVDSIITFVNEMFGEEPYQEVIFDRWWTLETSWGVEKLYYVEERILPDELKKFDKTGNMSVDYLMESLANASEEDDD